MIDGYLAQDIWHRPRAGTDADGQPVAGQTAKSKGRWLEKRRLVRNRDGEQIMSEVSVTLEPDSAVAAGDHLSADGTVYLEVITVSKSRDLDGSIILVRAFC